MLGSYMIAKTKGIDGQDAAVVPVEGRVFIVDDAPINVRVVQRHLERAGISDCISTSEPAQVMGMLEEHRPDVMLLDLVMPDISGLQLLQMIRESEAYRHMPVVMLTASCDRKTRIHALDAGATDFIAKPVDPFELIPRMRNMLLIARHHAMVVAQKQSLVDEVRRQTQELVTTRLDVVHCLARAAECRDNHTGKHVVRVGQYARLIAENLGLDRRLIELIATAAPLHDVGKLGLPDSILLKAGKLDPDEIEAMRNHAIVGSEVLQHGDMDDGWRRHAALGFEILGRSSFDLLHTAARIALTHHEWWDGTGYPRQLRGEEIPLEGRITAVADVFDALSSARPYKEAFHLATCLQIMKDGSGTQFDPTVLGAFMKSVDAIRRIQLDYADMQVGEQHMAG